MERVQRLRSKVRVVEGLADLFKALADDTRLKVIYALAEGELCVCDVVAVIGQSLAAASYHLRLLYRLGLVKYRREGKLVFYRLADERIGNFLKDVLNMRGVAGNGAENAV
ncbi:ArsR/SmtB family transcription factor [Desulfovirgula thermocuniculi]|uniref:ArsR/SmtB family transcription factor n=1 Tax=Desulfovirgula thermocuniculi TaxID=348842 RepID=UPI0006885450|nr:metalloregulator ArsR/SmtB family transcription factor [Desulfovirgula thermocuniculi]